MVRVLAALRSNWVALALIVALIVGYVLLPGDRAISRNYIGFWGLPGIERIVSTDVKSMSVVMRPDATADELNQVLDRGYARGLDAVLLGDYTIGANRYSTSETVTKQLHELNRRKSSLAVTLAAQAPEFIGTINSERLELRCKQSSACPAAMVKVQALIKASAPDTTESVTVMAKSDARDDKKPYGYNDTVYKEHPYNLCFRPRDTSVLAEVLKATEVSGMQPLSGWDIRTCADRANNEKSGYSVFNDPPYAYLTFADREQLLKLRPAVLGVLGKRNPSVRIAMAYGFSQDMTIEGSGDADYMLNAADELSAQGAHVTTIDTRPPDPKSEKTLPQMSINAPRSSWAQVKATLANHPQITVIDVTDSDALQEQRHYSGTVEEFRP
jgi:hypothetical protein